MRAVWIAIGAWAGVILVESFVEPFLTVEYARSEDGSTATLEGSSKAIALLVLVLGGLVGGLLGNWLQARRDTSA